MVQSQPDYQVHHVRHTRGSEPQRSPLSSALKDPRPSPWPLCHCCQGEAAVRWLLQKLGSSGKDVMTAEEVGQTYIPLIRRFMPFHTLVRETPA